MKRVLLILLCLSVALSAVCSSGESYDCSDIVEQGKCSGVVGGRQCQWNSDCGYQTCEQLSADTCVKGTLLSGKQCFKNVGGICAGASSCSDFDSKEQCSNYKNVKCSWDETLQTPICRSSSCLDVTDPQECQKTMVGSEMCNYWRNLDPSCQGDQCSFRQGAFCDGKSSNGYKCIKTIIAETCKAMTCDDVKWSALIARYEASISTATTEPSTEPSTSPIMFEGVDINTQPTNLEMCFKSNFELGASKTCVDLPGQSGVISCKLVETCSDVTDMTVCPTTKIGGMNCVWDSVTCRSHQCRDSTSETVCVAVDGCTWANGACTTCALITDGCACLANTGCFWQYNSITDTSYCQNKKCSLATSQSQCTSLNLSCYWNTETLVCGTSQADTGFVQGVQDNNDQTDNSEDEYEDELHAVIISLFAFLWTIIFI